MKRLSRRPGFTLVEGLITLAVSGMLLVGIVTFFGDFLQRFAHQEDTLSGSHQAQLLMEYLRRDVRHLDGRAPGAGISSSSETGTTFPKYWVHACHVPGEARLKLYARKRTTDAEPIRGNHPASAGLLSGVAEAAAALAQIERIEHAYTWVAGDAEDPDQPQFLVLNVREGAQLARVVYTYRPGSKGVSRKGPDGKVIHFANPTLQGFRATPYIEVVHDPADPDFVPRVVKTWLEVGLEIRADAESNPGNKIAGRAITLTTRLLPFFLNASLKSTWSP